MVPFEKSWWVKEGQILGGCYPGTLDPIESEKMHQALVDLNVGLVINLQETDEIGHQGQTFVDYRPSMQSLSDHPIEFLRLETPDCHVPNDDDIHTAIRAIDKTLAQGLTVYIHCWGGHGRTAVIAGCYLRSQGLEAADIWEHFQNARAHSEHLKSQKAPQTKAQIDRIISFSS